MNISNTNEFALLIIFMLNVHVGFVESDRPQITTASAQSQGASRDLRRWGETVTSRWNSGWKSRSSGKSRWNHPGRKPSRKPVWGAPRPSSWDSGWKAQNPPTKRPTWKPVWEAPKPAQWKPGWGPPNPPTKPVWGEPRPSSWDSGWKAQNPPTKRPTWKPVWEAPKPAQWKPGWGPPNPPTKPVWGAPRPSSWDSGWGPGRNGEGKSWKSSITSYSRDDLWHGSHPQQNHDYSCRCGRFKNKVKCTRRNKGCMWRKSDNKCVCGSSWGGGGGGGGGWGGGNHGKCMDMKNGRQCRELRYCSWDILNGNKGGCYEVCSAVTTKKKCAGRSSCEWNFKQNCCEDRSVPRVNRVADVKEVFLKKAGCSITDVVSMAWFGASMLTMWICFG